MSGQTTTFLVKYQSECREYSSYNDAYDHAKNVRDKYNIKTEVFEVTRINFFDPDLTKTES